MALRQIPARGEVIPDGKFALMQRELEALTLLPEIIPVLAEIKSDIWPQLKAAKQSKKAG